MRPSPKGKTLSVSTGILQSVLLGVVVLIAFVCYMNSRAILVKHLAYIEASPDNPLPTLRKIDIDLKDVQQTVDDKRQDLKGVHELLNWMKWYGNIVNEHLRQIYFTHLEKATPKSLQPDIYLAARKDSDYPISEYPTDEAIVKRFSRLPDGALDMRVNHQLNHLKSLHSSYYEEFLEKLPNYCRQSVVLSCEDSFILFAHVRETKPTNIIVLASQHSDYAINIMLTAIELNKNEKNLGTQILAVSQGHPIQPRIDIDIPAYSIFDAPEDIFTQLALRDFLYIEGPMITKIYGPAILQLVFILPLLKEGVYAHFSGIFLPEDYPELWMNHLEKQYTQQWLLAVFLFDNQYWQVHLANHFLFQQDASKELDILSYNQKWKPPTSFYIHKTQ